MSVFDRIFKIAKSQWSPTFSSQKPNNWQEFKKEFESRPAQKSPPSKEELYRANLEVEKGASLAEIRKSYKRLLRKYHPDLYHNDESRKKLAVDITTQLNEAMNYFEKNIK